MKISNYQIDNFINNFNKKSPFNSILLYGSEYDLISIRLNKITNILKSFDEDYEIVNFSRENFEKNRLVNEYFSTSLFSKRKIIKINKLQDLVIDDLKIIFNKETNSNFVLLIENNLPKTSTLRKFSESSNNIAVLPCWPTDENKILNVIRQELSKYNFNYNDEIVCEIYKRCNKSQIIVKNEIEKLDSFFKDNRNLTLQKVGMVISYNDQIDIDIFINHFASLEVNSIQYLDFILKSKTNSILIIRSLSRYFLKIKQVKISLLNEQNTSVANQMKLIGIFFRQEKIFKQHLNMWKIEEINNLLLKLQHLEASCKSNDFDNKLLLKYFVTLFFIAKQKLC